jgi:hypothetical protein
LMSRHNPPEHHPGRGPQFCGNPNIQQQPWYTFFSLKNRRCYCDKSFSSYGILLLQLFFVYLFSSWPPRNGHPKPPKQARRIEHAVLEFIALLVLKVLATSLHSTWPGSRRGDSQRCWGDMARPWVVLTERGREETESSWRWVAGISGWIRLDFHTRFVVAICWVPRPVFVVLESARA